MARKNKEQWNNKSPEYNTQKFDTDINQKMYCGTNTSRAVITLAPKQSFEDVLQNFANFTGKQLCLSHF